MFYLFSSLGSFLAIFIWAVTHGKCTVSPYRDDKGRLESSSTSILA